MLPGRGVLLVEGASDADVIKGLWRKRHGTDPPFEVDARSGLPAVRETFRGSLFGSEISRLGVVVDADAIAHDRYAGFYQTLVERGYRPVPKAAPTEGLVLHRPDQTVPVVGVWIMPDNRDAGALEEFVSRLVRPGNVLWEHARGVVAQIPEELQLFPEQSRAKAHLYTWLAWQAEPGVRLRPALERNLLDSEAEPAAAFLGWLARMFVDDPDAATQPTDPAG
jgi:hypothetical protein